MIAPRKKHCLKIWLGVLVAASYIVIILFTLWAQKRREFSALERVVLPVGQGKIQLTDQSLEILAMQIDNERTEADFKPSNLHYSDVPVHQHEVNLTERKWDNFSIQPSMPNETDTFLKIVGHPNRNKTHFASFGFTTPRDEDYFYAFSAPLAVRAWKRIGYDCVVFIIGNLREWMSRETLKFIYSELVSLRSTIIFLKSKPENEILLSQACRLFAANFFSWENPGKTFMVTTDVDLWPLNAALFDIPQAKRIMSLNSECCGSFDHGSHTYRLLPIGNIVTDINTWKEIINILDFYPRTVSEIIDYFFREFGPIALEKTRKDEYIGWYMDQRMISMRLSDWIGKHGGSNVEFVPRDVGRDRLDVNYWMPYSLHGKSDIHILPGAYKPGVWEKIRPLFKLMYSKNEEYEIVEYRETFMKLYISSQKYSR